jgi:copper chaperone CopZ
MKNRDDIALMVEGIQCSGCAMDVETILLGSDGIDAVDFSISTNTIKILYDTGEIEVDHIVNRVRKQGLKTNR